MRFRRDVELFHTHTTWAYQVGQIHEHEGKNYKITKVKYVAPTRLLDGTLRPCAIIIGRELKLRKYDPDDPIGVE